MRELFVFSGRLNRLDFFLRSLIILALKIVWPWGLFFHHGVNIDIDENHLSWPHDMGDIRIEGPMGVLNLDALHNTMMPFMWGIWLVHGLLAIAIMWFYLASQAKRLHDMNASGWFVTLNLIPPAGFILWLVTVFGSGTIGDNKYGPDPLAGRR